MGNATVGYAMNIAFGVIALARELENTTFIAIARAVWYAVATDHMAEHLSICLKLFYVLVNQLS